jgi:hypothetical protein
MDAGVVLPPDRVSPQATRDASSAIADTHTAVVRFTALACPTRTTDPLSTLIRGPLAHRVEREPFKLLGRVRAPGGPRV